MVFNSATMVIVACDYTWNFVHWSFSGFLSHKLRLHWWSGPKVLVWRWFSENSTVCRSGFQMDVFSHTPYYKFFHSSLKQKGWGLFFKYVNTSITTPHCFTHFRMMFPRKSCSSWKEQIVLWARLFTIVNGWKKK